MHKHRFSSITLRILLVNISALLILGFGLLYTGEYEKHIMQTELNALKMQTRMLAEALQNNVKDPIGKKAALPKYFSRRMLELMESNNLQGILFDKTGRVLIDNRGISDTDGQDSPVIQKLLSLLPTRVILPRWPETDPWLQVQGALKGENWAGTFRDKKSNIVLAVSMPAQKQKVSGKDMKSGTETLAVVFLMKSGGTIDTAVRDIQLTVIKLFLWAFFATIMLSIYLSETIASPLLQMARAAEKAKESLMLKSSLPDLSYRRDEIGALSEALNSMTTELSARIDAISGFAADVAHELKNPLASLRSAVETLLVVQDEDQRHKLMSIIAQDVSRINRLITDISMASRLDSEISRAERKAFDLVPLLGGAAEAARMGANIRLHLESGRKLRVNGNDAQLEQVIQNILRNAVSFVSVDGNIDVSGKISEGKIVLHIDNDGPPIPERKLEAIFERFYSERPRSEDFGLHSGLGLSISRQIVRAHGGTVFAQNLKASDGNHKGVRFTVILPAAGAT